MTPADFQPLYDHLAASPAAPWLDTLPAAIEHALRPERNGHWPRWQAALQALPAPLENSLPARDQPCVQVGPDAPPAFQHQLREALRQLHPWRKGPFCIHGVHIDAEWRSDWKWARLEPHITPLTDRRVLDIGCGNGYYLWRMDGAKSVIGIDPTLNMLIQFFALRRYLGPDQPVFFAPVGIEAVPPKLHAFDTVFSMGILYHRRAPLDHLRELHGCLRPGGQLVLETLVIDGPEPLTPQGRYAKMRNVWCLPTPGLLVEWLRACGYENPRVVDLTPTTPQEQRRTEWMTYESLTDFLNPTNPARTVENHPAPVRSIVLAESARD